MTETKDLLLLEKQNWEKFDEKVGSSVLTCPKWLFQVHTILKSMVSRLKNIGYEARIFGSVPVTPALFNLVSCCDECFRG